jgi:hypothetical protein
MPFVKLNNSSIYTVNEEKKTRVVFLPVGLLCILALNFQVSLKADYTAHEVYQIMCSPMEP